MEIYYNTPNKKKLPVFFSRKAPPAEIETKSNYHSNFCADRLMDSNCNYAIGTDDESLDFEYPGRGVISFNGNTNGSSDTHMRIGYTHSSIGNGNGQSSSAFGRQHNQFNTSLYPMPDFPPSNPSSFQDCQIGKMSEQQPKAPNDGTMSDETDAISKLMLDMWENKKGPNEYLGDDTSKALVTSVEKLVAKELFEMENGTREAMLDELHGVKSRAIPESPELIEAALRAFDIELQNLDHKKVVININQERHSLDQAHLRATMDLQSNYVTSPEFRIRFLRAELFDVKKAVIRYCRNLNYVWDLFGDTGLLRQIYLSDLNENEIRYLKEGRIQCLTSRDKMGRRIYFAFGLYNLPIRERMRVEMYLGFVVTGDDVTSQKYGGVVIIFASSEDKKKIMYDEDERQIIFNFTRASPIRYTGLHFCMPDETIYKIVKTIGLSLMTSDMRATFRVHTGSHMECNYALSQFGIPIEDIPISVNGTVKSRSCLKMIKARNAVEDYIKQRCSLLETNYVTKAMEELLILSPSVLKGFPPSCPGTDCPDIDCIVFGDRALYNHSGNVEFRDYLRRKRYLQTQRKEEERIRDGKQKREKKRLFIGEFLDGIIDETSKSYKFAYYDKKTGWYAYIPVDTPENRLEIRKRISQIIRDERKRERALEIDTSSVDSDYQSAEDNDKDVLSAVSKLGVNNKRFKTNKSCSSCV